LLAFSLGIILFAVGALIGVIVFFLNVIVARREQNLRSLPLFTFGLVAAAIIAVISIASGAMIYIPTFFWSLDIGVFENLDPATYKLIWWGLGHGSQQINVTAMVSIWYLVAFLTVGGLSVNEKVSRVAFLFYILFICLASAHHILVDPAVSSSWKVWNTSYAMYLAVLASMIHAFAVPATIEVAQRQRGYVRGLFEWLAKAPWGNPAFSAIVLAIIGFGFIGGITGTLAFIGALIWVLIVVISVFFGPKVNGPEDMQLPIASPVTLPSESGKKFLATQSGIWMERHGSALS